MTSLIKTTSLTYRVWLTILQVRFTNQFFDKSFDYIYVNWVDWHFYGSIAKSFK